MKYIFLLYANEATGEQPGSPEFGKMMEGYFAFNKETSEKGILIAGEALEEASTSTSLRVRNGKSHVTDGPFAETKEQLGGFYVLECKDLDEALAYAAKIPAANTGTVEIRPLMEIPESAD